MNAMCESLADTLKDVAADNLTHAAVLARLLETELESRSMAAQRRRIRAAAFPQLKYLDDLVREELPEEARAALPELETLEFVRKGRNLVLYGNPGTGKTHLATALGIAACQRGFSVLFTFVPRLLTMVREAKSQHKLTII